jgi:hypothetical protein
MTDPMSRTSAVERLTTMAADRGETWDLSPTDQEALRHVAGLDHDVRVLRGRLAGLQAVLRDLATREPGSHTGREGMLVIGEAPGVIFVTVANAVEILGKALGTEVAHALSPGGVLYGRQTEESSVDLDALEALLAKVTGGPWRVNDEPDNPHAGTLECDGPDGRGPWILMENDCATPDDLRFIAAARNAMPALIAEVRRLRAEASPPSRKATEFPPPDLESIP